METRLGRIEDKIDKLLVTTERNTVSLEEHMRRTDALEVIVNTLKRAVSKLEKHRIILDTAWKVLVALAAGATALNQLSGLINKLG